MASLKCGFRPECFSKFMLLLTDIVAAFVFIAKKFKKKTEKKAK